MPSKSSGIIISNTSKSGRKLDVKEPFESASLAAGEGYVRVEVEGTTVRIRVYAPQAHIEIDSARKVVDHSDASKSPSIH